MDCFPPCRVCTGLCKQETPAREPLRPRKKAVTPVRMPGYVVLVCGHYTTLQEQVAVPGFRKSRKRYWCEKHNAWCAPYTFAERIAEKKEEPMFLCL